MGTAESGSLNWEFGIAAARLRYTMVEKREEMI
jgi:hypothetical protein